MAACSHDSLQSSISNMPTPSLILVPARFKTGKLYTPVATTSGGVVLGASGDFNVTRATTATRFNSAGLIESVASGIPRLDYYTSGGTAGCPALLVEPSGSNLALQSEAFNTTWSRIRINAFGSGSVANTTGTLDPYGTNLADYLQEDTSASDTHRMNQSIAVVSGTTYSMTCFLKSAERFQVGLYVFQGGVERYTIFNLASGTATATNATGGIENYGNGWYRCRTTFTATASGTLSPGIYLCDDSGNLAYTGTGTKGLYAFGFQFETGSVATSYIPTTTASVTRNADVINLSGAVSGCIGQTEGTIYAEVDIRTFANAGMIATISDGTASNRVDVYKFTDSKIYFDRISSTQSAATGLGSAVLTAGIFKVAVAYKSGDTTMYINGTQVGTTQTQTFTFSSLTKINIGVNRADTALFFNDRIRSAALYTTRLTNAELAALTQI
jgi:hypothetical protein